MDTRKRILVCGTAPSAIKLKEMDLSEYIVIGVNFIEKLIMPDGKPIHCDYHAVMDIKPYFSKRGWKCLIGEQSEREDTVWLFHKDTYSDVFEQFPCIFVRARWDVLRNTTFDIAVPFAIELSRKLGIDEIHYIGVGGGPGHFYDDGDDKVMIQKQDVVAALFDVIGEKEKVKFANLADKKFFIHPLLQ